MLGINAVNLTEFRTNVKQDTDFRGELRCDNTPLAIIQTQQSGAEARIVSIVHIWCDTESVMLISTFKLC